MGVSGKDTSEVNDLIRHMRGIGVFSKVGDPVFRYFDVSDEDLNTVRERWIIEARGVIYGLINEGIVVHWDDGTHTLHPSIEWNEEEKQFEVLNYALDIEESARLS